MWFLSCRAGARETPRQGPSEGPRLLRGSFESPAKSRSLDCARDDQMWRDETVRVNRLLKKSDARLLCRRLNPALTRNRGRFGRTEEVRESPVAAAAARKKSHSTRGSRPGLTSLPPLRGWTNELARGSSHRKPLTRVLTQTLESCPDTKRLRSEFTPALYRRLKPTLIRK